MVFLARITCSFVQELEYGKLLTEQFTTLLHIHPIGVQCSINGIATRPCDPFGPRWESAVFGVAGSAPGWSVWVSLVKGVPYSWLGLLSRVDGGAAPALAQSARNSTSSKMGLNKE